MEFYYINHLGEKIDLSSYPYLFQEGDLLDWNYSYQTENNRCCNFKKEPKTFSCKIAVLHDITAPLEQRKKNWKNAVDELLEKLEADIIANKNGTLYADSGYYMFCRFVASNKENWRMGIPFMFNTFSVLSDYPVWIKESTKQFLPHSSEDSTDGLDFPFDFAFDFAPEQVGVAKWSVDHYAPSDFRMIVYGPCSEPKILINGHPYQIHTELEASDYLVIDSRKNTVTKYMANGTTANLYNSRNFKNSVFEKIPAGDLTINWSGNFGFDITLYLERSEPKWGTET